MYILQKFQAFSRSAFPFLGRCWLALRRGFYLAKSSSTHGVKKPSTESDAQKRPSFWRSALIGNVCPWFSRQRLVIGCQGAKSKSPPLCLLDRESVRSQFKNNGTTLKHGRGLDSTSMFHARIFLESFSLGACTAAHQNAPFSLFLWNRMAFNFDLITCRGNFGIQTQPFIEVTSNKRFAYFSQTTLSGSRSLGFMLALFLEGLSACPRLRFW
jgi:hypothetical protein